MHKTAFFPSLPSPRLRWKFSPAKTQRPQRIWLSVFFLVAFYCLPFAIHAQSTGAAKGKIRNTKDQPISNVSITARKDSKDVTTVSSNNKGEFVFSSLEPGVYNFLFDAQGYSSALRSNIEVRRNKTVDLGDRLILVVDKGTLIIIQGSVFFKDGTSVTGAKVELEKINSDGTTRALSAINTNIYGEFNFHQPEGVTKYRLTAKYKDHSASKEIEVGSAAIYRLAIHLDVTRGDK